MLSCATLPSLESLKFGFREPETEDQRVLVNLEPLKELLRTPDLRFVGFSGFYFTNELCHATANALEEGSSIPKIAFDRLCIFPDGGRAIIAKALKTNAAITDVEFYGECDEPLCDTLAVVLLCNSTLQDLTLRNLTLQDLTLRRPGENAGARWLCPIFLSLGMNTTLKRLSVSILDKMEDKLCAAIRNGLTKNSTLEDLSLHHVLPSDDDGTVSARNALSFLRTDSNLKSLTVSFALTERKSYALAFRLEAVKMMEENPFHESLTIITSNIEFEELFALVSALQLNTTLKTLNFQSSCFKNIYFTVNELNQLIRSSCKTTGWNVSCLVSLVQMMKQSRPF